MDGAAGAPKDGFTAFFGALLDRRGLTALPDNASRLP
jgi:hypothetical protein